MIQFLAKPVRFLTSGGHKAEITGIIPCSSEITLYGRLILPDGTIETALWREDGTRQGQMVESNIELKEEFAATVRQFRILTSREIAIHI